MEDNEEEEDDDNYPMFPEEDGGTAMEDNEEEEDNDNYPMFTEDGGTTMGEDEAEEEPIVDEPDDDLRRAILDAQINCGSENERLKLESMLEDDK